MPRRLLLYYRGNIIPGFGSHKIPSDVQVAWSRDLNKAAPIPHDPTCALTDPQNTGVNLSIEERQIKKETGQGFYTTTCSHGWCGQISVLNTEENSEGRKRHLERRRRSRRSLAASKPPLLPLRADRGELVKSYGVVRPEEGDSGVGTIS